MNKKKNMEHNYYWFVINLAAKSVIDAMLRRNIW
jgi:hypothetical protein